MTRRQAVLFTPPSVRADYLAAAKAVAEAVGLEYYTMVSMIEAGRGRIPPDSYLAWAAALQMQPAEFVRTLMQFYDPITHSILFGEAGTTAPNDGDGEKQAPRFRVV